MCLRVGRVEGDKYILILLSLPSSIVSITDSLSDTINIITNYF